MTPEERQMLADLFERIKATGATPRDAQAEAFINDAVRATPFAPYVLSQTVLVQQQALEAAARKMSELEAAARQSAEPQEQGSFLGNLGKSLAPASTPPQVSADRHPRRGRPTPRPRPRRRLTGRRSLDRGARPRKAAAEDFSRTPHRPQPVSPAASPSAASWVASLAVMGAAACSAAALAAPADFQAGAGERRSTISMRRSRAGAARIPLSSTRDKPARTPATTTRPTRTIRRLMTAVAAATTTSDPSRAGAGERRRLLNETR